ncbi:MAG: NYN domain-containing protein [Sphingomonadales bacterium]|nr:MAG: NYN domain-containing protein [Sphingomonadales bacterium]
MATKPEHVPKLAILIDADNASPRIASGLFEELATIGEASVRRIYGDFSGTRLKGWSDVLSTFAILPHHNIANTPKKNASDIALVIDAMDLLHSGRFDAFCIVSSDGDFTRLAARIREQGADVYGFGEQKTPESFRKACKRFIYIENLISAEAAKAPLADAVPGAEKAVATTHKLPPSAAVPLILNALAQMDDLDGWYFLGAVGTRLAALMPDFDQRSYGCAKLVTLIERSGAFEVRRDSLMVHIKPLKTVGA